MKLSREKPLILVVDDEPGQRLLTSAALNPGGFTTLEAEDGANALRLCRSEQPDLVLLDIVMPGLDGFVVCQTLRQQPGSRDLPILIVTGLDDLDSIEKAYDAGATDFITKPIQWLVLSHRLRYMLRASQTLQALRESEEQIRFLAYYDHLTHLPNRMLLHERLQKSIESAKLHAQPLAVLFIDLDQFKRINDSLGHHAGDLLLQQVAARLQDCLRSVDQVYAPHSNLPMPRDILARLGGDEFVVLLNEASHSDAIAKVAERILTVLSRPFLIENNPVFTGCSIGVACYPIDGDDMETLLKNADAALYHAKSEGRNNYQFYSGWMHTAAVHQIEKESLLRKALDHQELALYYQPQVDLDSRRMVGVEALLHWHSPQLGDMPPADFIPIAEETGLIIPIGEWVIQTAIQQARAWREMGLPPLRMAINLSPRQVVDARLAALIAQALEENNWPPDLLDLEITESLFMKDQVMDSLLALKQLGIRLVVDDFGAGYANFSYLRRFPIDRLKIDKSFLQDIQSCEGEQTLAAAVIAMARSLRLGVIAEGVETATQMAFLQAAHCNEMQGFLFSQPCSPEQIAALLRHPDGDSYTVSQ
ncbi:MAG: EAL domain-containing protein [Candidatus Competibacteraceae bacterium]|nr:EAL domain-containing protein [Candidatus Competibacteraceae bacterium]MCB1820650.1 EAL domain-containing protein [Candidatus Competibacteraceae bacterium]HRY14471.1 EAL domain-containing protein [Candidatus Competibacteraceae bacterium]